MSLPMAEEELALQRVPVNSMNSTAEHKERDCMGYFSQQIEKGKSRAGILLFKVCSLNVKKKVSRSKYAY